MHPRPMAETSRPWAPSFLRSMSFHPSFSNLQQTKRLSPRGSDWAYNRADRPKSAMPSIEAVKDFALQIEKTLSARRLYHSGNAAYIDAFQRLLEKCRAAAAEEGFTLFVTSTDLFLDKFSVLNRPKHDDSFFFPLFRDGLREVTFLPNVTAEDLDALLSVLETKDRDLGATDDMINHLWRRDLSTIIHKAIDGIGESEEDGEPGNELHSLVVDVSNMIKNPAPPSTGQKYAFVMDADVRVAQQDLHYNSTTLRRTFEENPSVLRLAEDEAAQIRTELGQNRDQVLVERFIEILLVIVRSPLKSVDANAIAPMFQQLAEGYWSARDYNRVAAILTHVNAAATEAANPEYRAALADIIRRFLSVERLNILFLDFVGGALPPQIAARLWDLVPDEVIWPILLDSWSRLPDGETRVDSAERPGGGSATRRPGRTRGALESDGERSVEIGPPVRISSDVHRELAGPRVTARSAGQRTAVCRAPALGARKVCSPPRTNRRRGCRSAVRVVDAVEAVDVAGEGPRDPRAGAARNRIDRTTRLCARAGDVQRQRQAGRGCPKGVGNADARRSRRLDDGAANAHHQ